MTKLAADNKNKDTTVQNGPHPGAQDGGEMDDWEKEITARLDAAEASYEALQASAQEVFKALRSLVKTFDTPSQIEKRAILEDGIRAVNNLGESLGCEDQPIPLG